MAGTERVSRQPSARARAVAAGLLAVAGIAGCRATAPSLIDPALVHQSLPELLRPLEGDPAALYRLRVPNAANLRLALLVAGDAGRMTVSERFGSALSLTAWEGGAELDLFDFREGCMVAGAELSQILGVAVIPMPQAVRFLVGRLPALAGDGVEVRPDGSVEISGSGWAAVAEVRPGPWRVVGLRERGHRGGGWTIAVSNHSGAVPSVLTIRRPSRGWAELELVRLEWDEDNRLPALPALPECVLEGGGGR